MSDVDVVFPFDIAVDIREVVVFPFDNLDDVRFPFTRSGGSGRTHSWKDSEWVLISVFHDDHDVAFDGEKPSENMTKFDDLNVAFDGEKSSVNMKKFTKSEVSGPAHSSSSVQACLESSSSKLFIALLLH